MDLLLVVLVLASLHGGLAAQPQQFPLPVHTAAALEAASLSWNDLVRMVMDEDTLVVHSLLKEAGVASVGERQRLIYHVRDNYSRGSSSSSDTASSSFSPAATTSSSRGSSSTSRSRRRMVHAGNSDCGASGYCPDTDIHYCCGKCTGTAACPSVEGLLNCACLEPGDVLASTQMWLKSDKAKIVLGVAADVALFRGGTGELRTGGAFAAAGDVTAANVVTPGLVDGVDVGAFKAAFDALDAVAVRSSSEGSQTLGDVTAASLAVTGGLRLGQTTAACDDGAAGTLRWSAAETNVEVCTGEAWAPLFPFLLLLSD